MKFSAMFWNVERFGRILEGATPDPNAHKIRVEKVKQHIRGLGPDLFCLCEIRDKVALRSLLTDEFTDYDFGVTDGVEQIELLAGWRRGKFKQVLFTQRREFKAGSTQLRPGSLASVKYDGEFYNFLFLHTDSGTGNRDYSNRQEMFEKIWRLKDTLDGISGGPDSARFAVMGDLNTMGRRQSGQYYRITEAEEISDLARDAQDSSMRLLSKTHDATWRSSNDESNLDHGVATANLTFCALTNATSSNSAEISVDGWNHLQGQERENFTRDVSDHCSIYCEVE